MKIEKLTKFFAKGLYNLSEIKLATSMYLAEVAYAKPGWYSRRAYQKKTGYSRQYIYELIRKGKLEKTKIKGLIFVKPVKK